MHALNSRNRATGTSAGMGRRLNVIDRCREQAPWSVVSGSPWSIRSHDSKEYKMSIADFGLTPDRAFMAALPPIRLEKTDVDVKNARIKLLHDLTSGIASQPGLADLLKKVSAGSRRVVPSDFALAGLLDSRTGQLNLSACDFPGDDSMDQPACTLLGEVLAKRVLSTGKPWTGRAKELVETSSAQEPNFMAHGLTNVCALPLINRDHVLGFLAVCKREEAAYTCDEVDFLVQASSLVALAVENTLVNGELRKLQNRDRARDSEEESLFLPDEVRCEPNFDEIVGRSAALQRALREVEVVAPTDSGVLIQGETGTGKELIARAIHNMSDRRNRPFVKLSCAAIPSGLLESELFGHEKGAFTGAIMRKAGRFEVADTGTLFLDEVGDIPLELQSKLLRVLQEQEFERLGSTRTQQVDVRVIAATHRDLKKMVEDGEFRSDLFYRLHVFPLVVPPLRDRREDIPMLVRHYVDKYARRMNKHIDKIPTRAMDIFTNYAWPGNVRELQNFIERAVILSPETTLRPPLAELTTTSVPTPTPKLSTLEEVERDHVLRAIREANWVIGGPNGAAARLGMKRTTLTYRIRKLKIPCRPQ
jgi:formate hydrogenlyase transcriptional activator